MNSEREAFLQAVIAAPRDDTPRLVFADWLDERGDPLGGFIRLGIEFSKLPPEPRARRNNRPEDGQRAKTRTWQTQAGEERMTTEIFVQQPTGTLSLLDGKAPDDAYGTEDTSPSRTAQQRSLISRKDLRQ